MIKKVYLLIKETVENGITQRKITTFKKITDANEVLRKKTDTKDAIFFDKWYSRLNSCSKYLIHESVFIDTLSSYSYLKTERFNEIAVTAFCKYKERLGHNCSDCKKNAGKLFDKKCPDYYKYVSQYIIASMDYATNSYNSIIEEHSSKTKDNADYTATPEQFTYSSTDTANTKPENSGKKEMLEYWKSIYEQPKQKECDFNKSLGLFDLIGGQPDCGIWKLADEIIKDDEEDI